jgi:hypothetical protein
MNARQEGKRSYKYGVGIGARVDSIGLLNAVLWHEAALGMMEATARVEAASSLRGTHRSGRFWNACHGGQVAVERGRYV